MARSTRLFEIIQLLRHAKTAMTAQTLADELEVSKRTVYRDIAALQMMRLPIDGEAGIGYMMRAGYDLPPLMFTQDEMEAIIVELAMSGRTGDQALERSAKSAVVKIRDVLPVGARRSAPLQVSRWNCVPDSMLDASKLRQFIREEAELCITYVDLNGNSSSRDIKALTLIYYVDVIVLVAWCELRKAFRHFRIDRIEQCEPTGVVFTGRARRCLSNGNASSGSREAITAARRHTLWPDSAGKKGT